MSIHLRNRDREDFQLTEGRHRAVITGVIQIGSNKYSKIPIDSLMIEFTILDDENLVNGKSYEIFSADLGYNSKLTNFLESWRGRPFTNSELNEFDLSKIIGKSLTIYLSSKTGSKGKVYFTASDPQVFEIDINLIDNLYTIQYDFEENGFNQEELDKLPDIAVRFIKSSIEYEKHEQSSFQSNYRSTPQDTGITLIGEEPF